MSWTRTARENEIHYTNTIENADLLDIKVKNTSIWSGTGISLYFPTKNKQMHDLYNSYHPKSLFIQCNLNAYFINFCLFISEVKLALNFIEDLKKLEILPNNIINELKEDIVVFAKRPSKLLLEDQLKKITKESLNHAIANYTTPADAFNSMLIRYLIGDYLFYLYLENKVSAEIVTEIYRSITNTETSNFTQHIAAPIFKSLTDERIEEIKRYEIKKTLIKVYKEGGMLGFFSQIRPKLPTDIIKEIDKLIPIKEVCSIAQTCKASFTMAMNQKNLAIKEIEKKELTQIIKSL